VIFYDSEVDALYRRVIAAGYQPDTAPRDAEWGERFFHLTDPDGHELSFAWPLPPHVTDQLPFFEAKKLRPTFRKRDEVEKHTVLRELL
jgi:hypothetical protein